MFRNKTRHVTGNFELMTQVNTRLVLNTVYREKEISRAELAIRTHLQPATVGNIVSSLIEKGLLIESHTENKGIGRPSRLVRLNDREQLILAIDLEPERLRIAITTINLDITAYSELPLDRFSAPKEILSKIASGSENLLSANSAWRSKIIGVGMSLPGDVDIENGILRGSTNMPNWHDVRIVDEIESSLKLPVKIGKSIHLAALSEKWRRPETWDKNILCLVLRTGVGISVLIKGSLYYGASHFDGEIGHTVVDINGKPCECGKRGCLETFISSDAIRQRGVELIKSERGAKLQEATGGDVHAIGPDVIYALAKQGDEGCVSIVREVARYLGLAAANIVQVLNPHEVVICGSIDLAENLILDEMDIVFTKILLPRTRKDLKLLLSPYKERASLLGAAVIILDDLFSMPDLTFPSALNIRDKPQKKEYYMQPAATVV